ncbi:MAG: hypothetical protein ILM98_10575 [Kiritimatiellae bacterium]|nr:hypothetical protein [Kiritimatiellia bacterium]
MDFLNSGTFTAAYAATMLGDLLRSVAEAGFVWRAGLSLCDDRQTQALSLPSPSRLHGERVTTWWRGGAGDWRPCISPAPRSGNPAGEMTGTPAPPRRKIVSQSS